MPFRFCKTRMSSVPPGSNCLSTCISTRSCPSSRNRSPSSTWRGYVPAHSGIFPQDRTIWTAPKTFLPIVASDQKGELLMAKSQIDAPVWFVTGCSSGFGREFVRSALAHRFRVVATARDPKKLDDIIAGHKGNAIALPLDVTNAEEIKYAVSEAERVFGRIDVL